MSSEVPKQPVSDDTKVQSAPPLVTKTEVPLTDTLYNLAYNSLVGGPMHGL